MRLGACFLFCVGSLIACATGGTDPASNSDDDGSTTGVGAAGGSGGQGGESVCANDCSTINAPDCYVSVCNDGAHAGPVGDCVIVPAVDGTLCDDGAFCTTEDSCIDGTCTGGPPNDCGMAPPECMDVVCNEATDECGTVPALNGQACTAADFCLQGSTCTNGMCAGGTLNDCFFVPPPNECHVMTCNPGNGMCEPEVANEGGPCTDPNDLCSVNDTCVVGVCQGGTPLDCSQLTAGCDLGICNPVNGMCTTMTVMDGQMCDDLDACTTGELCSAGNCINGSPVTMCSPVGDGCCPANCNAQNDIDCACTNNSFLTTYTMSTGWDGIMFDIAALETIEIQSFDVNIDPGLKVIEIYYKQGTYAGFESNAGAWTMAGYTAVAPAAADVGTPVTIPINVQIPAGQSYAFYIVSTAGGTVSNGINYIHGGGILSGQVWMQDSNIQILGGIGRGYPFTGSTYQDRGFSGVVYYEKCGM